MKPKPAKVRDMFHVNWFATDGFLVLLTQC